MKESLKELLSNRVECFVSEASEDNDSENKRKVDFTWEVLSAKMNSLEIQIRFADPLLVSPGSSRDILVILVDLTGLDKTVTKPFTIQKRIPKQMPLTSGA